MTTWSGWKRKREVGMVINLLNVVRGSSTCSTRAPGWLGCILTSRCMFNSSLSYSSDFCRYVLFFKCRAHKKWSVWGQWQNQQQEDCMHVFFICVSTSLCVFREAIQHQGISRRKTTSSATHKSPNVMYKPLSHTLQHTHTQVYIQVSVSGQLVMLTNLVYRMCVCVCVQSRNSEYYKASTHIWSCRLIPETKCTLLV